MPFCRGTIDYNSYMSKRIYLCLAHMSGREQQYIQEAFDTNWVVPLGPNVNGFEKDLEDFVGEGKRVVALQAAPPPCTWACWPAAWARATRCGAEFHILRIDASNHVFGGYAGDDRF